jgi:reductive dehalogenase
MTTLEILLTLSLLFITAGFVLFALVSLGERHRRAARLAGFLALPPLILLGAVYLFSPALQIMVAVILGVALVVLVVFFLWPTQQTIPPSPPPQTRVDERTTIFARARLVPGSPEYRAYYQDHPEHQASDDAFRANPGLLAPGARFYDGLLVSSPEGSFFLTEALREAVDGPVATTRVDRPKTDMTNFIKGLAAYHGALDVGICELQPYHIYSHIGRGSGAYGAPITLEHRYAIAITVEMDHAMLNSAPRMPTVIESARQYAASAQIAVILAAAIRALGYLARAHIDGNYRVIAPLVAKDAGLGEIGRMGLLMTPRFGPRVRLAVVTTDLPLSVDSPSWDPTVIDFCTKCTKCAAVCPAQAIPTCERETYPDGTLRWKINPERCYTYWTKIGTDCGRCMAVCPYAHADNAIHNLIRFSVGRSANFRSAAVWLDDLFYGEKPRAHQPPRWLDRD